MSGQDDSYIDRITSGIEWITPDIAQKILADNARSGFRNRTLTQTVVQHYAAAMAAGVWACNGEPVVIGTGDELLDGQHRIHGVIVSNTSHRMLVVRNMCPSVFRTMGSGMKRTAAQVLAMAGHKNASVLSAAAKWLKYWDANNTFPDAVADRTRNVDPAMAEHVIERHPGLVDSVRFVMSARSTPFHIARPLAAVFRTIFCEYDAVKGSQFFTDLNDMRFGGDGCPVRALTAAYASALSSNRMEASARVRAGFWFKAFNLYLRGEGVSVLRCTSSDIEALPRYVFSRPGQKLVFGD